MAVATTTTHTLSLTEDGSYAGTADGDERVRLTNAGMNVSLWDIDTVSGSAGNDVVAFGGVSSQPPSNINLRSGHDALRLRGGENYVMKLKGVESITAEHGSSLMIVGRAKFTTDGSFSIAADSSSRGGLSVEFADIADDITLSMNKGFISFGSGFEFKQDGDGRLVVSSGSGHQLTFVGVDQGNKTIIIVNDGVAHTYAEMLSASPAGTAPTVTEFVNDHPDGVWSDDDRIVTFVAKFSEAVSGVSAQDISVSGGALASGPYLAADGLSVTFAVETPLGANSWLSVRLADTITDLEGQFLESAYSTVRVDLTPPIFYGMRSDAWQGTNADSIEFRGQFSKLVTQLSADDFILSGTTATITSIDVVQADQYAELSITVSGGDLANLTGSIILSFAPSQDITDLYGRPLVDQNLRSITIPVDNVAPDVNVADVSSIDGWGLGPGFGIQGSGIDPDAMDPKTFDWTKLWISVDDGGPNITFSLAEMQMSFSSIGFLGFVLSEPKLSEIHARVDGLGDRFVIADGFWCDPVGNVQIVGGGIDTLADMF